MRGVRRFMYIWPALGAFAAENIHDDPRRKTRRSADLRLDVDVHVLLQLCGALPAPASDHADHARPCGLLTPGGTGAEDAADARLFRAVLGKLHPLRPPKRNAPDHGPVFPGWIGGGNQEGLG